MKNSIKHVVMSKRVAQAYLDNVGQVTSTITVYFSDERQLVAFEQGVKSKHSGVQCTRGFDYLTFLSEDRRVAGLIADRASKDGLTMTGF
jgi:hypothetical protein